MTATSKESIYEAALDAVRALAGNDVYVRVLVTDRSNRASRSWRPAAAVDRAEPQPLQLSQLADERQEALLRSNHRLPSRRQRRSQSTWASASEAQHVFASPLFLKDELRGLLVVGVPAH